jgi:hypothetical protein
MTKLDQELRSMCDDFANRLTLTVRRSVLEQVVAAMGGNGVTKRGPGRPRGSGRGPGRPRGSGKRSPEQVAAHAERIASYVRANPGSRLEQIATGLGTGSQELKLPVVKLLASKTLRKTGQKRGTMYFARGGGGGATKEKSMSAPKAKAKTKAKRGRKARRKKA